MVTLPRDVKKEPNEPNMFSGFIGAVNVCKLDTMPKLAPETSIRYEYRESIYLMTLFTFIFPYIAFLQMILELLDLL